MITMLFTLNTFMHCISSFVCGNKLINEITKSQLLHLVIFKCYDERFIFVDLVW